MRLYARRRIARVLHAFGHAASHLGQRATVALGSTFGACLGAIAPSETGVVSEVQTFALVRHRQGKPA